MINKNRKMQWHGMVAVMGCWALSSVMAACKHIDEEPQLNQGYDTSIRMPDAEEMTAEDSAVVAAQKAEYELNAK